MDVVAVEHIVRLSQAKCRSATRAMYETYTAYAYDIAPRVG